MPTSTVELQGEITLADFVKFRYFHKFCRRSYLAAIELAFLLLKFILTVVAVIVTEKREAATNVITPLLLFCLWIFLLFVRPYTAGGRQMKTEIYHGDHVLCRNDRLAESGFKRDRSEANKRSRHDRKILLDPEPPLRKVRVLLFVVLQA